jgi:hypothetical protein
VARQTAIEVGERGEQAGVVAAQARRSGAGGAEIAGMEAVGDRNHGNTHGAVFVEALRPGQVAIDPECERHSTC